MGKTREKSRGKIKGSLGLKVFLVCLIVIIVGLAVAIIIVISNNGKKENPEMSLEEYYNEYFKDVDKIYDNNPDNIEKVVDYFTDDINSKKDDMTKMTNAIRSEIKWFEIRKIENREALLEGLMRLDYSSLMEEEIYDYYTQIIDLAKELNKNEIIEKYKLLRESVREKFWAALEVSKKNLEETLNNISDDAPSEFRESIQRKYDEILKRIERYKEENGQE